MKKASGIKAKAKTKPESKPEKVYVCAEPVCETFEEAFEAAQKCTKCMATAKGFEGIRIEARNPIQF